MELRPEYLVFLKWCIGLRDRSAGGRTRVCWRALKAQWTSDPAFDASINVKSLSSMGIVTMVKMNPGQSGTRVKVGKLRKANSGGSSSESSDGETEQAAISEGRPASRTAAADSPAAPTVAGGALSRKKETIRSSLNRSEIACIWRLLIWGLVSQA